MTSRSKPAAVSDAPPPRRSQPRGVRSARKLLESAAALFIGKGIDETTVDDIVSSAGIAKGTFYHHYESKAALLAALRASVLEDFQMHVDAALAECPADDLPLRLDTWVKAACEGYILMIPRHDVAFVNDGLRWTASDKKHQRDLVALLAQGNEEGVWAVKNPHLAATFIFRGLLGVIDDLVLTDKNPKGAYRDAVELARRIVGCQRPQEEGRRHP